MAVARGLEELEILMYALELEMVEEEFWKNGIFERASRSLKIFMVRNVSKEEKVEDLRKKLIRKVREEEKKRAMDLQNLTEKVITTVKEAMMNHKREGGVSIRRCFYCDIPGRVARSCYWRKDIILIKVILSILFMTAKPKAVLKL